MNPLLWIFLQLLFGGILLYIGAESTIFGASSLGRRLRVSPLLLGLTLIGYGSSLPEMVVSVEASWYGNGDIAIGNIVGSNICNLGLILGFATLISPIDIKKLTATFDGPILMFLSVLFYLVTLNNTLSRWQGLLFICILILYTFLLLKKAKGNHADLVEIESEISAYIHHLGLILLMIFGGIAVVLFGARTFLIGAVGLSKYLGVSEGFIGLTVVSIGTGLPELTLSLVAVLRRKADMLIGTIIGSNIYNILGIGGFASLVSSIHFTDIYCQDFFVMLAFTLAIIVMMAWKRVIGRVTGGLLFGSYFTYLYYLILRAA